MQSKLRGSGSAEGGQELADPAELALGGEPGAAEEGEGKDGYATHYHTQFRVLLQRAFMNSKAELFTFLNAFQTTALAVACGLAWFQMGRTEKSIADRGGFIFFYMVYWFFNSMFTGNFVGHYCC